MKAVVLHLKIGLESHSVLGKRVGRIYTLF